MKLSAFIVSLVVAATGAVNGLVTDKAGDGLVKGSATDDASSVERRQTGDRVCNMFGETSQYYPTITGGGFTDYMLHVANALASAVIVAANHTKSLSDVSWVCNFTKTSSRWSSAFGSSTLINATSLLCNTSFPPEDQLLERFRGDMAALYILDVINSYNHSAYQWEYSIDPFFVEMCNMCNKDILASLWVPYPPYKFEGRITNHAFGWDGIGYDACDNFCYFACDDPALSSSVPTGDSASPAVKAAVTSYASQLLARAILLALDNIKHVRYLCVHFDNYKSGLKFLGLSTTAFQSSLCVEDHFDSAMTPEEAEAFFFEAATNLLRLQLVFGGTAVTYRYFLCQVMDVASLNTMRVNGSAIYSDICRSAYWGTNGTIPL